MRLQAKVLTCVTVALLCGQNQATAAGPLQFRELFNGKDL